VNFSTQTHDFDPGFGEPVNAAGDRTFWTVAVPDSAVKVNFAAGRAEMHVHNLEMEDYFNLPNAAADGDPPGPALGEVDATVSIDVVWNGPVTRRVNVKDAANQFAGNFVENAATVTWSGSEGPSQLFPHGFTFQANPGSFGTSVPEGAPFAELGHERNGSFFAAAGDQGGAGFAFTLPQKPAAQDLTVQQPQLDLQQGAGAWTDGGAHLKQWQLYIAAPPNGGVGEQPATLTSGLSAATKAGLDQVFASANPPSLDPDLLGGPLDH